MLTSFGYRDPSTSQQCTSTQQVCSKNPVAWDETIGEAELPLASLLTRPGCTFTGAVALQLPETKMAAEPEGLQPRVYATVALRFQRDAVVQENWVQVTMRHKHHYIVLHLSHRRRYFIIAMLLQTRGLAGLWLHSDEGVTGRYTLGAILGQRAYGTVKKAVRKADGAVFAIKHIDKTKLRDEDAEMLEAECAVLRQVGYDVCYSSL